MATTDLLIHRPVVGCSPHVEEEQPMTLQVALVGTDGIVLASDMKVSDITSGVLRTFVSSKIQFSPNRKLVVACARDDSSLVAGKRIVRELESQNPGRLCVKMETIGEEVIANKTSTGKDGEVIAISLADLSQVFHLRITSTFQRCMPVFDKAVAGHDTNSSIFFAQRYYQRRPVNELIVLAAHVVQFGAKLNSSGIEGLEIIVCQPSGFHQLSPDSIAALEARVDECDTTLGHSTLSPLQKLTYIPDVIS
jgi:hypothetical protein